MNQFHYDVRNMIFCRAAIQQAGDVWMAQASEYLSLGPEASKGRLRVKAPAHHLDSDFPVILIIRSHSAVDLAHASRTDFLDNFVLAKHSPDQRQLGLHGLKAAIIGDGWKEIRFNLGVGKYEGFDFIPEATIIRACFVEIARTKLRLQVKDCVEHVLDLRPALGSHAGSPLISRYSHTRAVAQSRFTVAEEIPRTAEVSSIERPAKKRSSTMRLCCSSKRARLVKAASSATTSRLRTGAKAT